MWKYMPNGRFIPSQYNSVFLMKRFLSAALLLMQFAMFAQDPCQLSTNVTDSLGTYKTTVDYIMHEQNFGGKSTYIFFSLTLTDDMPTLSVRIITKSKEFVRANCFDKNSRLYLQLDNGKIVTLMHIDQDDCGTSLRDEKGFDNRIQTGTFMFMKNSMEELESSPISLMRLRYATETVDFVMRENVVSELTKQTYHPQTYFKTLLPCLRN